MLSSKIKYFQGEITKKKYKNGQLAIFVNGSNGEPIAELSINDYSIDLTSNEIILKNYSENSQIAQDLLDSEGQIRRRPFSQLLDLVNFLLQLVM